MITRHILETTYKHECNIYSVESKEAADGSEEEQYVLIAENVKCNLSKRSIRDINLGDMVSTANQFKTLICSDLINVSEGFIISSKGIKYKAGIGILYEGSHQEVPISIEKVV